MRWGEQSAQARRLEWVRPLHSIVATFGPETEEPEIVRFAIDGITAGNTTYGHRFLAPGADHGAPLRRLCGEARKGQGRARSGAARARSSCTDAKNLAFAQGFELVEDEGLLARGRRAGRMAGRADGHVRRGVPADSRRGDPRHHPQQPEMLRAARSADRASSPTGSFSSPTSRPPTAARRSSPATSA